MFFDLALAYDPASRRCDLVVGDDEDLTIDETPVTPMLLSIGLDRRAAADDILPAGQGEFLVSAGLSQRRGWAGDALDAAGELTGSRIWLLDRAKQTETARLLFVMWLEEAMAWTVHDLGQPAEIEAEWVRPNVLGWRVRVGETTVELTRGFA